MNYTFLPEITLPEYFDREKFATLINKCNSTRELMEYLDIKDKSKYSRFMKPMFPNRTRNKSYLLYLKSVIIPLPQVDQPIAEGENLSSLGSVSSEPIKQVSLESVEDVSNDAEFEKFEIDSRVKLYKKTLDEAFASNRDKVVAKFKSLQPKVQEAYLQLYPKP